MECNLKKKFCMLDYSQIHLINIMHPQIKIKIGGMITKIMILLTSPKMKNPIINNNKNLL